MNTIAKLSVASALTLSYVSAHAAFVGPTSTAPGDVFLFAEVLNSAGTLVGSYAGDTQVTVSKNITSASISASSDSNLQSLLTLGAASGNTIEWAVQGGGSVNPNGTTQYGATGNAAFVTTLQSPTGLEFAVGGNLPHWANLGGIPGTNGTIPTIVTNLTNAGTPDANSIFGTVASSAGVWDTTILTSNVQNWYSNGANTAVNGLGSSALFFVTGNTTITPVVVSTLGTATLSASGFTYSTEQAAVPLPAAIWLLGSGLLGLAGVGRRKAVAVAA